MKHVLIFSTAYFPHVGGAEVAIKEITDRLQDVEFSLICARLDHRLPREERVGRVLVYRVGPGVALIDKLMLPFSGAWRARSLGRFDAYWAVMVTFGSGAAFIANIAARRKIPIVLTLQEGDSEARLRFRWFGLIDLSWRLALRRADAVSAISTYLAKRARRLGFRGQVSVVPNGVDVAKFSREFSAATIDEIKDKLGKKMGDVFLVTTSRLVHKNAIDDVIRALPLLPENVSFIVLGIGPDEAMLKMLAEKIGVEGRVRFVGQIGHQELPKYLKACDIFIRPSRSEGMGNSFVEAMAAGLPVIATQEGGIADFLFDEARNPGKPITGFAVDKDSPEQIAGQVKNIMANPEKVRHVVATAKAMVEETYDWDKVARRMREIVFEPFFKRG